jgi:hypothetical protein
MVEVEAELEPEGFGAGGAAVVLDCGKLQWRARGCAASEKRRRRNEEGEWE